MEDLARRVVDVAKRMDAAGFAPTKSGNVSVRAGDGMLITPSGLPYAAMEPSDVVAMDLDGCAYSEGHPSSEWRFHAAVYRARPDAQAIVHTHSPRATALACARRPIPAFHYMIAFCGGADIRCADYATFGTPELAEAVVAGLEGRKATLLANHGVVAIGASVEGAFAIAGEVENLAGQYLDLLAAGLDPVILDDDEMRRVAEAFGDYGKVG
ncbi:MAG: class II aldolase [Salinarimonadaceae bacterium]|nr:MAG: class II aldolase [Salinarimonadaceae bacterium]